MQKYIVKSLSVGGKNNKIFKSGDIVTELDFAASIKELELGGYVEKHNKKITKIDAPSTDAPSTDAPSTDAPSTDAPSTDAPSTDAPSTDAPSTDQIKLAIDGKTSKSFSKPEVVEMLTKCQISFDPDDSKSKLFTILVDSLNG